MTSCEGGNTIHDPAQQVLAHRKEQPPHSQSQLNEYSATGLRMNQPTLCTRVRLHCPELRRALIKIRPSYFLWPQARQERYGVTTPDADNAALKAALFKELFGRTVSPQDAKVATVDCLSDAELRHWDETLLPFRGIGEDYFYWAELLGGEVRTILDFDTLQAFDEARWRSRENPLIPDYTGKPYNGSLYLDEAQLYIEGRFSRARLSMAAGYLYSALVDASRELLEAQIPYRYVPAKHHGKVEGRFWRWDVRVNAGGQEAVVEELQRRVWDYERERFDTLLRSWDAEGRACVYRLNESDPSASDVHFVFADINALAAVQFRTFLRDCEAIEKSADDLNAAVSVEKTLLARFIEEQHAEIARTRNPKVLRFRPRVRLKNT
jgi:hypothetical protein